MGECGRTCFEHWEEPLLGAGRTASNQHSESWLWPRPISQHVSPNRPYKVNKSSMAWRRLGIACSWRMPDVDFSSLIFLNSGSVVRMAASFLNQQWFIAPGLCHCYINIVGILWNWRFNHLQDLQDPASSTSTCVLYPGFFAFSKGFIQPTCSSCQGSIFGASTLLVTAWSAILSSPRGQSFLKKTTTAVDDAASRWPKAANLGDDVMEQTKKCWETTWNDVFITIFGNDEHFINPYYVTKLISFFLFFFLNLSFCVLITLPSWTGVISNLNPLIFPSAFLAGGVPGQYGDSPL